MAKITAAEKMRNGFRRLGLDGGTNRQAASLEGVLQHTASAGNGPTDKLFNLGLIEWKGTNHRGVDVYVSTEEFIDGDGFESSSDRKKKSAKARPSKRNAKTQPAVPVAYVKALKKLNLKFGVTVQVTVIEE
jgi:hypothetical protein